MEEKTVSGAHADNRPCGGHKYDCGHFDGGSESGFIVSLAGAAGQTASLRRDEDGDDLDSSAPWGR